MTELFSDAFMQNFKANWNADPELAEALAKIGFNSVIGYGVDGEDQPRGVLTVENGHVTAAGPFNGEALNWDLRASADSWNKWIKSPPGMMGLGAAYTTRKLKFNVGDYGAMVKDPRMAAPFVKSFSAMG